MAHAAVGYAGDQKSPTRNIVAWVLCILCAAEFLYAGGLKLIGNPGEVTLFGIIGWGQWFRYFTAVLEILGAAGLLFPRRSRRSALLLSLVMLGAITFHLTSLRHTPGLNNPTVAIVTLVALLAIARLRRDFGFRGA
ncbi:MAG TPA: DoxX family protein [Bryobacteraceae bacterium]|nr:DoxX family protein [Bryobacteraceae bacterium]